MKDTFEYCLMESRTTKCFLYIFIAAGTEVTKVTEFDVRSVFNILVVAAMAWKTFMSNPNTGIKPNTKNEKT